MSTVAYDVGWAPVEIGAREIARQGPGPIGSEVSTIRLLSQLLVTADTRAIELHVQDQHRDLPSRALTRTKAGTTSPTSR